MKNEKYTGIYKHGEEIIYNMFPRIISDDLMAKALIIASKNKHGKRSVETVYLLRHKMKCGYCGSSISAETRTSRNGKVKRYYKCLGRKRQSGCTKSMVRKDELENAVIEATIKELSKPQIMNGIVKYLLEYQENQLQLNSILATLIKEQRQTENAIQNVMTAIENGVLTPTTTRRLKELENRQEELEKQILIERSKAAVKLNEKDIKEYYEQALKLDPQMLINYLIKEIVLFDDKIQIYYNSPIRISPDDKNNQGFIFYSKTVILYTFASGNLYSHNINVEMMI